MPHRPLSLLNPHQRLRRQWVQGLAGVTVCGPSAFAAEAPAGAPAGAASSATPDTAPDRAGASSAAGTSGAGSDPLKPWLQFPLMQKARLSSDGRYLAAIGVGGGLPLAYVMDLQTRKVTPLTDVTSVATENYRFGIYPDRVRWIGERLLVVRMSRGASLLLTPDGDRVFKLEGRFLAQLAPAEDGGERILLTGRNGELRILNVRTRSETAYELGLPHADDVMAYALDAQGRLRAATTYRASTLSGQAQIRQWYRVDEKAEWQLLEKHEDFELPWSPLRVADNGDLIVLARGDRDVSGVYRYNTEKRQLGELMAGHAREDLMASDDLLGDELLRIYSNGLKPRTYWFDAQWARLQASVDAALPGALNHLSGQVDGHVLVASASDVDPGRWFVLNTKTAAMREVGIALPAIQPARMRPMDTLTYKARDGLDIPAYLTRPAGQGPAPMVVLIHGGPWARDTWGWDVEVQLLAAQGYAVFQPQFRGSTGFGRAFQAAGYRQWGLFMQDDITDGVQHLVDQGVADASRVAIVAAAMGVMQPCGAW